jgi:hypothetical protein
MNTNTTLVQNLRSAAAAALISVALATSASARDDAESMYDAAPEHFQRDPRASPDVFAIQWAEIQATRGYARVPWHPLTGKDGTFIFVQEAAPRISGADIAATWATVCVKGSDDDGIPPSPGVVVQFQSSVEPRLAQIARDRMNRFLAVLAEGKVVSFSRVEWDLPLSLKLCLDGASPAQAISLARVLAGKPQGAR